MTLKHISPEEFKIRLAKLASENALVKQLLDGAGGGKPVKFENWPERLKLDAFGKMGIIREHDTISGITNFRNAE